MTVGCAQPTTMPPAAPAVPDGTSEALTGNAAKATPGRPFKTIEISGKLHCVDCGTELNSNGRHRAANLMLHNLQYLRSPQALKAAPPKQGDVTLKENVMLAAIKLGIGPKMGMFDAKAVDRKLMAVNECGIDYGWGYTYYSFPCYNASIEDAIEYVRRHPQGCCLPDNVPVPDPPY
jgi:hypothetical protein